ncbi:MAG TPA: M28 family metallopeptidase, partial [Pseudohaliea sp.]|nr:M28 family metallopeptidase [Pseudohaliea sp.]
ACAGELTEEDGADTRRAAADERAAAGTGTISADEIAQHVRVLASDEFGGRGPGTEGEELTLAYLERQFRTLGLEPAFETGYRQPVELLEITPDFDMVLTLGERRLDFGDDFVAWTKRQVEGVEVRDSELVFAGYGIVAPEYGQDDYAGVDWSGKTAVVLVNDPGFATGDPARFEGHAMTYYGRWTYKYEEAARQGAEGLLIIHETAPASYGWNVVESSWSRSQFDFERADGRRDRAALEGWITRDEAEALFSAAGRNLEEMKRAALEPDFRPVPLGTAASIRITNEMARHRSHNFAGILKGRGQPQEQVLYLAHWDAHGTDPALDGDTIYNGAADNATGVAALLEIAEAYAALPERPRRSVVFLAVTAEEQGLLGSQYFARHPSTATRNIVAALNMDIMSRDGSAPEATVIGLRQSELGDYARRAAARQGRSVRPHPSPESGYFFRSDHFSMVRVGVPSLLFLNPGAPDSEYVREHYHRPSDEYEPDWDLTGAAEDAELFFLLGRELAAAEEFPAWREGSRFGVIRKRDRGQ